MTSATRKLYFHEIINCNFIYFWNFYFCFLVLLLLVQCPCICALINSISSSISKRGKIGSPFTTVVPAGICPNSARLSHFLNASSVIFNCAKIFSGVCVKNGFNRIAIVATIQLRWAITLAKFSFVSASSFASTHGFVSSIYLLVRLTNCQTDDKSNREFHILHASSYFLPFLIHLSNDVSNSVIEPSYAGISPSKYLSIIATVRFNKLPRSFAKSKLIRSTKPSGVNTPSEPKGTSRNK